MASLPRSGNAAAVLANDGGELRANGTHPTITWVGHATMLVQLDGVNILTDPIWSARSGPMGIGPHRLVPPGLRFEDLPPIHAVIISHDHYDHLDRPTVLRLAREHHPRFFVPLGIGTWLREQGVQDVVELDWWDARTFRGVTFVATPAQHASGRDAHRPESTALVVVGGDRRPRALLLRGRHGLHAGDRRDRPPPGPAGPGGAAHRRLQRTTPGTTRII